MNKRELQAKLILLMLLDDKILRKAVFQFSQEFSSPMSFEFLDFLNQIESEV